VKKLHRIIFFVKMRCCYIKIAHPVLIANYKHGV
jgi:hypothetical protein